jgi:hypothetical protein
MSKFILPTKPNQFSSDRGYHIQTFYWLQYKMKENQQNKFKPVYNKWTCKRE